MTPSNNLMEYRVQEFNFSKNPVVQRNRSHRYASGLEELNSLAENGWQVIAVLDTNTLAPRLLLARDAVYEWADKRQGSND